MHIQGKRLFLILFGKRAGWKKIKKCYLTVDGGIRQDKTTTIVTNRIK